MNMNCGHVVNFKVLQSPHDEATMWQLRPQKNCCIRAGVAFSTLFVEQKYVDQAAESGLHELRWDLQLLQAAIGEAPPLIVGLGRSILFAPIC